MNLEMWIAFLVGLAAVTEDLTRRTISNWIPVTALAGGLICQLLEKGWRGIPVAVLGTVSGFAIFLVFYLLGGMGGGDIKLMAGFGAILGAGRLLDAAFWTAIVGAILATAVLGVAWVRTRVDGQQKKRSGVIPYAPAIAIGVWLALIPKN